MRTRAVLPAVALAAACCLPGATPVATAASGSGVWAPTIEATQGFDKLGAFPDGTMYVQYADTYAKSTDNGLTWTVMPRPPRQYEGSSGIRFATPKIGYSVNGDGVGIEDSADPTAGSDEISRCGGLMPLHRTTDGGATWHAVCVPHAKLTDLKPHFSPEYSALAVGKDGKTVVLVGQESDYTHATTDQPCDGPYNRDVILTSHDMGNHWTRTALPRGWYSGYRFQVYDADTIAMLEYKFDGDGPTCSSSTLSLWLSRDGGKSFQRKYTCAAAPACTSLAMVTSQRILLGRSDGSTLVSRDGGTTFGPGQRLFEWSWQPAIDSGQLNKNMFWVQAMSFADARNGFASTRGSGTWHTTDGGVSWTQERSHECEIFIPGVGEIAAGSPTTAITGGPHFISARAESPAPQVGCSVPRPQLPAVTTLAWQALDGSAALRADGTMQR
jgi:photosystem II stability/assembly factor-like uncharacterized protein